ncbi:MAG: IS1182 family transposase [Microthrixaceae bacterium]|jgi:IS5 family transposase|nr:IS1182 family transposase [Microthrixaceae bacterium]
MQGSSRLDRELLDAAALCSHLLGEGSVHAFLAEHRHRLFPDEMFADLFPTRRGRPSVPADVVATVMVLQALEGRSDREACRALQTDIAWKAAAGLALTDEAFHPTVLTLWRNKLRASTAPQRIFDAVKAVVVESGVIASKHRRALDSTVLDDAVARQDTVTMLVAQIRRVRKLVPELAAVWLREHNLEGSRPPCDWDDPGDRDRVVSELVDDANELVWAAEDLDLDDAQTDAVALLALVAGQDVEPGDGPGRWRIARRTAPDRVISTVDPEARHAHKTRASYRDGYKGHVAAEPDTGLVTACDIGPGNAGDAEAAPDLIAEEPAGTEVLGDSAYGSGEFRDHLRSREMNPVIKPPPLRPAVAGGYTLDDFTIDLDARTITCPEGVTVSITKSGSARFGAHCATCPVRARCTTAKAGRVIVLHPHHELLAAARTQADTNEFADTYRQHRPMIERTIAWLVKDNNRRLRYRGIEANRLGWSHRCAAVNLRRLLALGLTHNGGWTITPAT